MFGWSHFGSRRIGVSGRKVGKIHIAGVVSLIFSQTECVTFSSLPYYTQIHRTAFFPLSPILSQGLLYFYDLIWLTRSYLVASCLVRYSSDVVIRSLMYDTHLRATHTTTSSIRGVQIPIYLVSDATDSLQRSVAVLKMYQ